MLKFIIRTHGEEDDFIYGQDTPFTGTDKITLERKRGISIQKVSLFHYKREDDD